MILFKDKYRIPSARLKGWDYRNGGAYFITICVKDRLNHFGKCEKGKMILNEAGEIADKYWRTLPDHFDHVGLGEFVIMPNHIHGILVLDPPVETLHRNVLGKNTDKKTENDMAIQPDMQINDGNIMGDNETLQCNVSTMGIDENMENSTRNLPDNQINDENVTVDNETLQCNVSTIDTNENIENDATIPPDMQINDGNVMGDNETLRCNASTTDINENIENDTAIPPDMQINDGNRMGDNETLYRNVSTTDINENMENGTTVQADMQINDGNVTVNNETLRCNVSTNADKQFMSNISPKPGSVSTIVRSYKSACTKWINSHLPDLNFQWQERFHDHIIRNHEEYLRIENYIINNPENWKEDKFYTL